jgi:tetratricopeptide (TPR) repeat protein
VRRDRALLLYALLPVLVLCGTRVVTRNIDWRVEKNIFFSALDVCPLSVKAMTNAGMFKLDGNGGSNAESIDILTRGLAVYNKQSAANINLGIAHLNDGNFYEAAASYTRAQHIAGASPKLLGYLGNALATWSKRGGEGLDETSGIWLRESAARVIDDALAHGNLAPGTIVKRGLLALELRNFSEAADLFQRAIRITEEALAQPHVPSQDLITLPYAYGLLAVAHDELQQWPQAERSFRQALELNGEADCSVKNNLGMFYRERGRLQEAHALLSSCVSPAPNEVLAVHNNMGMIYADLGRWSDALASYQAALGALPAAVPATATAAAAVDGFSEDSDAAVRREHMAARIQANVREVLTKQQANR